MTIKLINRGETGELILTGRLDSTTADDAGEVFQKTAERFERIVLNFSELQYISSAGLRQLKLLYMTMQRKDGTLVLRNANEMVTEVLEMSGFITMFKVE